MKSILKAITLVFCVQVSAASHADEARIISAGSSITELLFALGADKKVIAVDLTSRHYLDKREIPVLGYHRQLGAEGLLALSPTHLIGSSEMGPDSTLNLLKTAGVKVNTLTTGDTLDDFNQRIDALAAITQTQENAKTIKADVLEKMETLNTSKLNQLPQDKKDKVLFMMMSNGRPITLAGNKTTINTVINLSGAFNPAAEQLDSFKAFSTEALVAMQPDYILIAQRTFDELNGVEGILKQHPLLKATPAVKNNRVIPIAGHAILGGFGLASLALAERLNETFLLDKAAHSENQQSKNRINQLDAREAK